MFRCAKLSRTLCVVIASSSAFAAPYAFKITCKDPARMRPVGEETEFRIQCTDLRKAGAGGEVEVRLDNFGTKTIISRKVDPAKENPIILKGTLDEYALYAGVDESLFKTILRKLGFTRPQLEKRIEDFSAGQKKKVLLARSLCEESHLLIWDEPLNYIDLISRMQIEELLLSHSPTILFVEHDRAFCDAVATKTVDFRTKNKN